MRTKRRVSPERAGERLDAFLAHEFPLLSRRQAKSLCLEKQVLLNGRPTKPGTLTSVGDEVELEEVYLKVRARPELVEKDSSLLEVLYEDDCFLAVSKPSQMDSVVIRGDDPLTVADYIAALAPACMKASKDPREAGLVQRLDFSTTGIILAAKSRKIWDQLHQMLLSGEIQKQYLALVEGRLSGTERKVDLSLSPAEGGAKMRAVEKGTEGALAAYSLVSKHSSLLTLKEDVSLLKVSGKGMRRHQVRAHLASLGLPLLGDTLYGASRELSSVHLHREGFLLHASELRFKHPQTTKTIKITSNSPEIEALTSSE